MTMEELEQWSAADITCLAGEDLTEILAVRVNVFLPLEARIKDYLAQVKNPYCFLCEKIPVKISFSDEAHTLHERLARYYTSRKRA